MYEHQKYGTVIFPAEPWRVTEDHFMETQYKLNETIFSLGNGYLGVRGGFEEGFSGSQMNGTYINGFYEEYPFDYPDFIFANPINDQFMVNVADAKIIRISIDGEPFSLQRVLLKNTLVHSICKQVVWKDPLNGQHQRVSRSNYYSNVW